MYEYTCQQCGKQFVDKKYRRIRKFCGKDCYGAWVQKVIPEEPAERSVNIHPDGCANLVAAICQRARADVLHYGPDSYIRQDAERFFRSEYFAQLTDMDGQEILRKLHRIYNKKHGRIGQDERCGQGS